MSRDISSAGGVGSNSQDFATAESLNRHWRSAQQQQQQTNWQSEQQQQSAWPSSDPQQPAWRLSEQQQSHWRSGPHTEPQSPWRSDSSQQQSSVWRSDPQQQSHWHPSWRSSEPQSTPLPRESDQLLGRSAEAQRAAEALLSSSLSSSVNSLASVHNDPVGRTLCQGLTRQ
jgi:hypothetical protein